VSDEPRRSQAPEPCQREVLAEIARVEEELRRLETERSAAEAHLALLRSRLTSAPSYQQAPSRRPEAPRSPKQKVALFRSLFAGRPDVFAKYWYSQRTQKAGYAPACANEWVPDICEKPHVKCGECPHQSFVHTSDRVLLDHLQGRHVVGIYPLLEDETCRLLAVDFDKEDWKEDVLAFAATCRSLGLTPAVERSRSGNGAHVWFFFSQSVPATAARALGSYLITETMAQRPQLSMGSYDRLFPNQSTMPRGGFGNLIALPLQFQARQDGNTVFVDDDFTPYADQWDHLSSLPRLRQERVEELAREAARSGRVVGIQVAECNSEAPWLNAPRRRQPIMGPIPSEVRAVLAQRLFVEKNDLPNALIDQIKRLAAFQNPEFYKKQAMRLSTALTPRVINCAEELPEHIDLPRGCLAAVESLLSEYGIAIAVEDLRSDGEPLDVGFHGQLTQMQLRASKALSEHDMGVLVAPPGAGKTVIAIELIARRGRNTLVLVHRAQLLDQWRTRLSMFLDLKPRDIGQLGGGKRRTNGQLDVATLQSIARRSDVDEIMTGYGHVIVDECHHVPAVSFERVMREVRARFITGLTATPERRDGHHPILQFQLGPVRHAVDPRILAQQRQFEHRLIVRETGFQLSNPEASGIQEVYAQLATDTARNDLILNDVIQSVEDGRSPIVLTERRDHLEFLAKRLQGFARHLIVLRGGMRATERREVASTLASIPNGEERVLLATGRFLGEGFDDPRLDTLFLAMPVSWKGTLVQYAGRLHRGHQGKTEVQVYDYVDGLVPVLARMFKKRLRGYRSMGYRGSEGEDFSPLL